MTDLQSRTVKKTRKSSPVQVNSLLSSYVNGKESYGLIMELKRKWSMIVGDGNSTICFPFRLRNRILHVAVINSAWMSEMPYMKGKIIEKLQQTGVDVAEIKFTLSKIKQKQQKAVIIGKELSPLEEMRINIASVSISKPELREKIAKAMTAYYRYKLP